LLTKCLCVMTDDYNEMFNRLRFRPENEVIEFKEAKESYGFEDLGKYFSAISNEANLRNLDCGWLIFGVTDKTRDVVGTHYKEGDKSLQKLKFEISQSITGGLTFRDIISINVEEKGESYRVLLFKIPASPHNIVTSWKNIAYARKGESLVPMDMAKQDEIRSQPPHADWSEQIVEDASFADLDELAIAKAKIMFAKVHNRISKAEISAWTDTEFLTHCGMMIRGGITRTALLLLGKPLSAVKLRPAVAEVTWVLKKQDGDVADYEHFGPPFVLTVDDILKKIRNITMREMPGGTLFPDTMQQYDDYTIREALHNCLAHQDYLLQQRINFVENDGFLYYENGGTFIPETLENVLNGMAPQRFYRNHCLCEAMYHLNMMDKVGRGIQKIFRKQKERHFPMPDYHIDNERKTVSVTIYGKVIDDSYAKMLMNNTDLSLKDCILLDSVQKKRVLTDDAIKYLRKKNLIEGRKPYFFICKKVADSVNQEVEYSKNKGLNENTCEAMIISALHDHLALSRKKINLLLFDLLPCGLSDEQKRNRVDYILKKMSKSNKVVYLKKDNMWGLGYIAKND
jgi:ATP-dependent DNA helicase RecG